MYSIKDFSKGQTVWIELTGNACRGKIGNELIEEWEVVSVGRKYVTARKKEEYGSEIKFEETYGNYDGLPQNTNYCVNYILYPCKEDILNKLEKENLVQWIKNEFSGYGRNTKYSLMQLIRVKEILTGKF